MCAYVSKVNCENHASWCCVPNLCSGSHQSGTTESHRSDKRLEDVSAGISGGHHQQSGACLKLKLAHLLSRWRLYKYILSKKINIQRVCKCALLQLCLEMPLAFCPHSGRRTLGCWRARSSPSPWLSRPPWRWNSSVGKPCTEMSSTGSSR